MYCGNIGNWISWWSLVDPDKEAVVFEDRHVSYRELNGNINRTAHTLRDRFGIGKGDRVACLLNNSIEYFETVLACAKIGARFVPFNIRLTGREIAYIARDSAPEVILTEDDFVPALEAAKEDLPTKNYIDVYHKDYRRMLSQASSEEPHDQAGWENDFAILYTSGTTGFPKGAVLTQGSIKAVTHNMMTALGYDYRDKFLLQLPLCFTGALITSSMPMFHTGGTIILEKGFVPARTLELIEREKVTVTTGVPTMWTLVSDEPGFAEADLSSIDLILAGGAPVPMNLLMVYKEKGVPFTSAYGLTEGGGFNMYLPTGLVESKRGGYLPLMWNEVKVVDQEGEKVPQGEIGEIIIRGSVVMRGYWNRPQESAEAIKDGWLYTGDLARVDEDGFCFIVDRAKDMIVSGGINTYPAEIENVIYAHPQVSQVAVIGLPHKVWGEMVTAVVVPKPGVALDQEELIRYCRENMADYKTPKSVIVVKELPMTTSGKVRKRQLRKEYGGRSEHFESD